MILSDEKGNLRIGLVMEGGPVLALADEIGKPRATLVVGDNGPELSMSDENGRGRGLFLAL